MLNFRFSLCGIFNVINKLMFGVPFNIFLSGVPYCFSWVTYCFGDRVHNFIGQYLLGVPFSDFSWCSICLGSHLVSIVGPILRSHSVLVGTHSV